jgi:hypothetical protein
MAAIIGVTARLRRGKFQLERRYVFSPGSSLIDPP